MAAHAKGISRNGDAQVPVLDKALKHVKHDMVLIRPHVKRQVGLIALPDAAQKEPTRGIVLAKGPGKIQNGHFVATTCEVGEDVIFPMHARKHHLVIDDERFLLIKDEDLLLSVVGDHDIKVGTTDV